LAARSPSSTASRSGARASTRRGSTSAGRRGSSKAAGGRSGSKPASPKHGARASRAGGRGQVTPSHLHDSGTQRVTRAVGRHFGAQRRDVAGIALLLLGVLTGLGVYADAAGPVGNGLKAAALGLLGLAGYLVPVLVVWLGLQIVIGREDADVGRAVLGAVMTLLAVLGGLHLIVGAPEPSEGVAALWSGGGLAGWALATPLRWALSVWGAVAVLVALGVLGMLIATRTPFSQVLLAVRGLVGPRSLGGTEIDEVGVDAAGDGAADLGESADTAPRTRATVAADGDTEVVELPPPPPAPPAEEAGVPVMVEVPDEPPPLPKRARKVAPVRSWDDYELPPLDLLHRGRAAGRENARTIDAQVEALQQTFHQFGVDATVARFSRGPTVTRFEIELGPGVQVKKVANMGDDIAYALAAPDVRIVAPIPGKSAIGVEVPNRQRDLITLGDILRSDEARNDDHPMTVALGVDIAGKTALVDLTTMPHLLVSGATGSGKSVTLNGMISSIVMRTRPDQVRLILIDPKRVELNAYEGAPHLLTPVVTDPRRATDAVQWCVKEMEQRYELLALEGFRNLDGYNEAVKAGRLQPRPGPDGTLIEPRELPYILLVIDELADLMLVAPRDVEDAICRIAQMARAVGIHMIIATQRPSVDVITGLIKANIPSRLALAVASQTDSRTILDANGAEKLVGKGDMLFLPASQGKASRLQGCWVTEAEVASIVQFCRAQREAEFDVTVLKHGEAADRADAERSGDDSSDTALLRRAADQVVTSGLGSTSMLQRKLRIGFARAGRLMDELEELGVVGPNEGSKAREVRWSPEELEDARERGLL
jgi:DNA segregation ATPase FtsK/SpoIIIE, S-DNA-T family